MAKKRPLLVLIDGNALVHRAYHALPPLTVSRTGEVVGAVYGFTSMLLKTMSELRPDYVAVAFDRAAPTFRHTAYEAYKAHRPKTADDLIPQFRRVREIVAIFNIPIYEMDGYEGDDIVGTLARQAEEERMDVVIVTGDADTVQLVSPSVKVLISRRGVGDTVLLDEKAVEEKYGMKPSQIVDLKGLSGDPSDNIPGVPGVGDKTATKLIQQFGSVEGIYDHIDQVTPPRLQETLRKNEEVARQSKDLATIVTDAPVELDLEASRLREYDRTQVLELFRELEFRSLLERLPEGGSVGPREAARRQEVSSPGEEKDTQLSLFGPGGDHQANQPTIGGEPGLVIKGERPLTPTRPQKGGDNSEGRLDSTGETHIVSTLRFLDEVVVKLSQETSIVFDTETTSKDAMRAELVGLAVGARRRRASTGPDDTYYIPVDPGLRDEPAHLLPNGRSLPLEGLLRKPSADDEAPKQKLPLEEVLSRLKPVLENPAISKVAHNAKYDATVLANYAVEVRSLDFDTMLAAYLLNEKSLGLKDLAFSRFGVEMTPITSLIGKGGKQITMAEVPVGEAAAYARADVEMTARLQSMLEPELHERALWRLFTEVEMPLVPVLVDMEREGVALDTDLLRGVSQDLAAQMTRLELDIYNSVGHKFNINSTKQLGVLLFDELKLPPARKTKTGYSTDAAVLDDLRGAHDVIELLLEYRQLSKLKSTYVDALPALINPRTGRVHTSFNQAATTTGRLSSSDPNLQNIPIRTEIGRKVRRAFIAGRPGWMLLSADYSQVELRILAHITQDPHLLAAFSAGEDIHSATAAQVFGVPIEQVSSSMRRIAKTVNFGVIYGMSDYGLSQGTDLSRREAAQFIDAYFRRYEKVKEYVEQTKAQARRLGYVQTLLNRRRYVPEITSANLQIRQAAERMAINMPIQGTAADIIKIAMVRLHDKLRTMGLRSKMLLQVHDELLLEVTSEEVETVVPLLRETMEGAFPISVALRVDVKIGPNWDEMREV